MIPRWDARSRREITPVGMMVGVGGTPVAVGVSVGSGVRVGVFEGGSGVAVAKVCGGAHPTRKMNKRVMLRNRNRNLSDKIISYRPQLLCRDNFQTASSQSLEGLINETKSSSNSEPLFSKAS
jgi:hypothetical protein